MSQTHPSGHAEARVLSRPIASHPQVAMHMMLSLRGTPSQNPMAADVCLPPSFPVGAFMIDACRTPPSWRCARGATSGARPRIQFKQRPEITRPHRRRRERLRTHAGCGADDSPAFLQHQSKSRYWSRNIHARLMTPPTAGSSMKKDRKLRRYPPT
ncbi:hypothetical protein C8J57DRAFT_1416167 [Mycena rebaudengoi]|nr:hypothetical protein C8J57DRAFT_1416167 [Mycena rebaudengoi]